MDKKPELTSVNARLTINGLDLNAPAAAWGQKDWTLENTSFEFELLPHQREALAEFAAETRKLQYYPRLDPLVGVVSRIDHAVRVITAQRFQCDAVRMQHDAFTIWMDEIGMTRQLVMHVAIFQDEATFSFSGPLADDIKEIFK